MTVLFDALIETLAARIMPGEPVDMHDLDKIAEDIDALIETLPVRRIVPADRRGHEVSEFDLGPIRFTLGVGHFDDGAPAEIFLQAGKDGTQVAAIAREAAVLTSLLLQHGVTVETILDVIPRDEDGRPIGPAGMALTVLEGEGL